MPASAAPTSIIVLLVEDEPIQRLALTDLIQEGGYEVLEAWDADSAIAILETRTDVRLVVADVEMPGSMDGLKLAAAVRHRWPPIEIILVSVHRPPPLEDLPARVEFVPKPYRPSDLMGMVHRLAH